MSRKWLEARCRTGWCRVRPTRTAIRRRWQWVWARTWTRGSARGGRSAAFLSRFAAGSGSTHAGYLSPAELRLLSEWLDIGAQYFNNPFDPAVPVN